MFKVLNLEVNHRQGNDKVYADMLNRIRIGNLTVEDISKLNSRVRHKDHPDVRDASLYIVPTRKACARYNKNYLHKIDGEETVLKANHYHPTQTKYKPFIDFKEGAIGTTSFLDEIRVKIGCKIILIHNVDTSDGLTNGQLGVLQEIIYTKDGKADKLVLKLNKKDAGTLNRERFPGISRKFPESVIIERISINYSIRKKGGEISSTATLVQFPIKVAHAITAHKFQGQTIKKPLKVAFDIENVFEEAQGYVMLSRVEELDQVYIIDDFNPDKLYPSKKALAELERMNMVSLNNNPTPWTTKSEFSIKVAFLNCAGLQPHYKDIKLDLKLQEADILHLLEISLCTEDYTKDYQLDGYKESFIKAGKGKGIGTYYKYKMFEYEDMISERTYQVAKFTREDLDVISIYRSNIGNSSQLLNDLKIMINHKRSTLIV